MENDKRIEEQIYDRQFNRDHTDCLFLVADLEQGGFGAMIARRKLIFQIAHAFNRTVLFRINKRHNYEECYKDYCQYSYDEIKKIYRKLDIFLFDKNQKSKVCYFNFMKYWNSNHKNKYQCWCDPSLDNNYLHFSGLILSQFKIKDDYYERIEKIKNNLDFSIPTIGIHVRRGDKGIETGKLTYVSLERYMEEAEKIKTEKGINRIFICSDSPKVTEELKEKYSPEYTFFQDEEEKRYNNANWEMVKKNRNLRDQETFTGVKIIELLSCCEYVIGQHNAQFAKLSGAKLSYKKKENRKILINYENNKIAKFGSNSATS